MTSMSVCVSVREHIHRTTRPVLTSVCVSPLAGARSSSGGVAMRYILPVFWTILYLLIMATNRRRKNRYIVKVIQRGQHGFDTLAYTQTDLPGGSTRPEWAESDVYD